MSLLDPGNPPRTCPRFLFRQRVGTSLYIPSSAQSSQDIDGDDAQVPLVTSSFPQGAYKASPHIGQALPCVDLNCPFSFRCYQPSCRNRCRQQSTLAKNRIANADKLAPQAKGSTKGYGVAPTNAQRLPKAVQYVCPAQVSLQWIGVLSPDELSRTGD